MGPGPPGVGSSQFSPLPGSCPPWSGLVSPDMVHTGLWKRKHNVRPTYKPLEINMLLPLLLVSLGERQGDGFLRGDSSQGPEDGLGAAHPGARGPRAREGGLCLTSPLSVSPT